MAEKEVDLGAEVGGVVPDHVLQFDGEDREEVEGSARAIGGAGMTWLANR
jgi:hypothetical protein